MSFCANDAAQQIHRAGPCFFLARSETAPVPDSSRRRCQPDLGVGTIVAALGALTLAILAYVGR